MTFPVVYAIKHKNLDVRMASRSGGIFTALSDVTLKNGGVVYGCVMNGNFEAHHLRADHSADRDRMRGSKYVQSNLGNVFSAVKKDLDDGLEVLFTGTSCQVAGLKAFLQKDYEKLLCVDIVCHGVPSPLVLEKYINWQESKHGKVSYFDFRNKADFGWESHVETLVFENGKKINSTVYKNIFFSHTSLRPCCFKCPYKSTVHPGDITIADYWGIEKAAPEFNDNKGVSLILVNNKKGGKAFEDASADVEMKCTKIEESMQPSLKAPFPEPANRSDFWIDFHSRDFGYIAKKYGTKSFSFKLKRKLGRMLKSLKRKG